MIEQNIKEMALLAVDALEDKKGEDITVIDISDTLGTIMQETCYLGLFDILIMTHGKNSCCIGNTKCMFKTFFIL